MKIKKRIILSLLAVALILVSAFIFLNQRPIEVFSDISSGNISRASSTDNTNNTDNEPTKIMSYASYAYYKNGEELATIADLIFIGRVVKVNAPEELQIGDSTKDIYTVSEFRVEKVIKGNINKGDIIKVKQIGGLYNGFLRIEKGIEFFKDGENRLLFLETFDSDEYKYKTPASPINPQQGSMLIVNGKTRKSNDFQIINDSVPEDSVVDAIKKEIKNIKDEKAEAATSTETGK
ncbi:hypothetical protein CLHUN_29130 [Ruminiclostridium hungatei]|uniref:Uncharacterized protein n=1 Tax=Ruminiclostridium hungatei TaxID=48256 RepID=A0A1V4SHD7_RUMHU|nr:hypothetical protein [Ruminiclostridium hungatei]OPX43163.1 hypothetical protein CLHUN_29130 [Ruminiclostridium hungatei]